MLEAALSAIVRSAVRAELSAFRNQEIVPARDELQELKQEIRRSGVAGVARVFLTPKEAAVRLAVKPSTIREWVRQGILPGYKRGGILRVRAEDLDRVLERCGNESEATESVGDDEVDNVAAEILNGRSNH